MKTQQEFEKWAILPASIEAAQATLGANIIEGAEAEPQDEMDEYTFSEAGGVAIIPVHGVIGHKVGAVAKMLGAVDALDVMAAIELAADDDEVDTIILDIDSPGGTVAGVPELAETIESESKVVVTEGIADTEFLLSCHTNFEFVLCPCVGNNLPIVLPVHERPVREHSAEEIVRLEEVRMPVVT